MRKLEFIFFSFTAFLFIIATLVISSPQRSEAAYCAGSITCHISRDECRLQPPLSGSCNPGEPNCSCSSVCGPQTQTDSCSGFSQGLCSDSSWWITYCNTGCPGSGALYGSTCNWQVGTCSVDSQCGSCSACCDPGNGPNYCRTDGKTCGGVTIPGCGATPTPTPVSATCPGTCGTAVSPATGSSCGASGWTWQWTGGSGAASGCPTNPNTYCYSCNYTGVTSAPTSTPAPTPTTGACTVTSPNCGGATCCSPDVCLGDGSGAEWCGPDPWAGVGGGDPVCIASGGVCCESCSDFCCAGYCAGSSGFTLGTCQDIPACSGCTFWNGSGCQSADWLCGGGQVCSGGVCVDPTYNIWGRVFIDVNGDRVQNCSGSCDNGAGDELTYSGATVRRVGPGGTPSAISGSSGYQFYSVPAGSYNITLTVPADYRMTTSNPFPATVGPDVWNAHFGIQLVPPPVCVPAAVSPGSSTVNPGASTTLTVTSCTNVENPDDSVFPPPFSWDPDTGGNSPAPTIGGQTDTPTSSTTTWTAPSCPASTTVYTPQVTVAGPGGTTNYSTSVTVPGTFNIGVNVRNVSSASSCLPTDGTAYSSGGAGATINVTNTSGSYSINQNQVTTTAVPGAQFTCLPPNINYQVSLQSIPGYSIVRVNNNGTQVSPGSSPVSITNLNSSRTVTFCIAPIDPWFQTTTGDVRFLNLSNPVPAGLYGSSDPTFPGIFYSSDSNASFGLAGNASSSVRQWVINNEYSYNANTENKNGGMSYDFYKNKALQDGVRIRDISSGILDWGQIDPDSTGSIDGGGSGVYEANGDIRINSSPPASIFNNTNKSRVVILTSENVTIDAPISIPAGQGLLIVAAKGNITISDTIGTSTLNSTTSSLDGFYTAQGSIVLNSVDNTCETGVSDLRLNVGGALIANSLKPFSTSGAGSIQNHRSLCINNLLYPPLYVAQRADFLTQLTDFYKTSYTKWKEVNP